MAAAGRRRSDCDCQAEAARPGQNRRVESDSLSRPPAAQSGTEFTGKFQVLGLGPAALAPARGRLSDRDAAAGRAASEYNDLRQAGRAHEVHTGTDSGLRAASAAAAGHH
jgi:hypothetical protein